MADSLETEVAQLKAQVRTLRWMLLGAVALGAVTLAARAAEAGPSELKVRRLDVVDARGVVRMSVVGEEPQVRINGKLQARKRPFHGLLVFNKAGDETGGFGTFDNGIVGLMLDGWTGSDVRERTGLTVLPDGSAGFSVNDAKGQWRVQLGVDGKNGTVLQLMDATERAAVEGHVAPEGAATWSAPSRP